MRLLNVDKIDPNSGTALEIGTSGDTVTVPSGVGLTLTDSTLLLPTTINTDKLDPKSGTALEIGTSGDTITVPTGAGLTVTDEVKTNKISPATGTAFALGDSGDTFTVPSGATIVNSGTATGFGGGAYVLLSTSTVSSGVSELDITSNIDSTYENYMISYTQIHPATDGQVLRLRVFGPGSPLTASEYIFASIGRNSGNAESKVASAGTTYWDMGCGNGVGNDPTDSISGQLILHNPSDTTFFKLIQANSIHQDSSSVLIRGIDGVVVKNAAAITGVRFFFGSGNIDLGEFKLYGIT